MKKLSLFIVILLIAAGLRLYRLGEIPEGFHSDEAAFGYNAYSILRTGRDEYGKLFPLVLQSFGDYKAALYSYIAVPFIALMGLNEWSTRLPSATGGILWVILVYVIVKFMTKRRSYAFVSMFLSAVSPSSVLLSRVQSDPFISVFFILLGTYFFFLWVEKRKILYVIISFILYILSLLTYVLPRVFLLFFLPFLFSWFYTRFSSYQKKITAGFVIGIVVCIILLVISSPATRLNQVSIFSTSNVQLPLEEKIREDGVMKAPYIITRAIHNKVFEYGKYLLHSYSKYFSFDFLYYQASQPIREEIPDIGVFLLTELPFFFIGVYMIMRKKIRWGYFCLVWALSVPALLSFTSDETPNIHRFFLANFPFHVITSVGIVALYSHFHKMKRIFFMTVVSILFFINIYYFVHQLFVHQPIHVPYYRGYSYKELVLEMKRRSNAYDIVISQKVLEHMLFYWAFDPKVYQALSSPRDEDGNWMGKYLFTSDSCPSNSKKYQEMKDEKKVMFVDKSECHVRPDDILETIRWRDGAAAFYLIELQRSNENVTSL